MKIVIIAFILQLGFNSIIAQNNISYQTVIFIKCYNCRTEFSRELKIDMTRTNDNLKVKYIVLDSLQYSKFTNSSEFKELTKSGLQTIVDSTFQTKILQLKEKYSVYFQDSLIFLKSANSELFENADLLGLMDDKFIAEINSSNSRIVLDGSSLKVTIKDMNGMTKTYWGKQPNESGSPITYKLITSLLNTYRTEKSGTVLEKGIKTFYY